MKTPLSWLKEYVDIELPTEELARRMTLAGLEVEEIRYVGYPLPEGDKRREAKITGFAWDPDEIVVGAIHEVMPHPNADRLVLCRLEDGEEEHTVLTGAPNLFPYKGKGELDSPLKVAYAREGATVIDAYSESEETEYTTIQRKKIRGVDSYSMACSERELGISDEHEGIIILDEDAPTGLPLVDYMGDVVFDIAITPNFARDANIIGVAREIAAITGQELRYPDLDVAQRGDPIQGKVKIEITDPELNPRFAFGLIENVKIQPSPYKVRLRLKLSGVRAINALVDATNYAMLELGEPLHAFDYDILQARAQEAGAAAPTIITRAAKQGETLVTLDDEERQLDDFTVLVTDQSGPLALAGVMGGAASEVHEETTNVLLEGAAWNMINTRRTVMSQNLPSEAAYRFSRGVHPELAPQGVWRGLKLMHEWAGGTVSQGLVDEYPLPPEDPTVEITPGDVRRWLGIDLNVEEIVSILESLAFTCRVSERLSVNGEQSSVNGEQSSVNGHQSLTTDHYSLITVTTPKHRLDIGAGVVGKADLMEEIARVYGYDRVPETRMADALPPQRGNRELDIEEKLRDMLVNLGLQEVISHRLTSPENEARRFPAGEAPKEVYAPLVNPISPERSALRRSLLASVLNTVEGNYRIQDRVAIFEIGPVFLPHEGEELPVESPRLAMAITGPRSLPDWGTAGTREMDFYDLKGIVETALGALHLDGIRYERGGNPSFHPGKCADVFVGEEKIGSFGELHPLVRENYDLPETTLAAAVFDLSALTALVPTLFDVDSIPNQPPVLEDLAVVIDEDVPAEKVAALIRQTGGKILTDLRLFDVYRGDQVGEGKKSLAYSLVYQHPERTLTDKEVAKVRKSIVYRVERELGGKLRE
ncbi:MAG: Phenylalanine--tRNA ligase beta subunit [Chloroflexi bacterium]|nr:Phenylalanine--tRNA ligase beta subunit [Chloroflexota bacterium]